MRVTNFILTGMEVKIYSLFYILCILVEQNKISLPVWIRSPIFNSDIISEDPFSSLSLTIDGKQAFGGSAKQH